MKSSSRTISFVSTSLLAGLVAVATFAPATARAAPAPSGAHPRLFLGGKSAALKANAAISGSATAAVVKACQSTIDSPSDFSTRGGVDGNAWPSSAVSCALAFLATGNDAYRAQAITYWHASLDDDMTLGDHAGCVAGVDTNWKGWTGSTPAPAIIRTVSHDTGYPIRWYGPFIAMTYDWLHDATGVDESLRSQTRTCLQAWTDWYTANGYHRDEAGANYNAGFIAAKAFTAVAMGGEDGADGDRIWNEIVADQFGTLLVGQGLAGSTAPLGKPAGVMLGGDSGEGWQYGPLTVVEYAAAARVLEEQGVPLPAMDTWVDSLAIHYAHATTPSLDGQYPAGDYDATQVYPKPNRHELDAILLGHGSDKAASFAKFYQVTQGLASGGDVYGAIAELRAVTAVDYRTTLPSLWYIARGTESMFARTAWTDKAYFGLFSSAPQVNSDHHHPSAGNFAFSRGHDHLIVDPSNYGDRGTLPTNAIGVDSPQITGDYAPSQTPWSQASLPWARASTTGVYAARSDFAAAFNFAGSPSDIPYAHRDWVMLPEGEMITIDRVHTADASHKAHLRFHTNTAGSLSLSGSTATGTVGSSKLVIHAVDVAGGSPIIETPPVGDCSGPFGSCTNVRFAVDDYAIDVPGPQAYAVHVFDGLDGAAAAATAVRMGDSSIDPGGKNGTIMGAAITRDGQRSYVVATRAADGATGATMTYVVPGDVASRHVVFDAPEDGSGQSVVTAAAGSGACTITITAGAGMVGRPLMFTLSSAADGCKAVALGDLAPAPLKAGDATPVTPPTTPGGTPDAGTAETGTTTDAGASGGDAGAATDDAGAATVDAGAAGDDAATGTDSGGASPPDATPGSKGSVPRVGGCSYGPGESSGAGSGLLLGLGALAGLAFVTRKRRA